MKKLMKLTSTVLAGIMLVSAVPAVSSSAATAVATPKITVKNVKKGVKISWKKAKGAKKYTVLRKLSTDKSYKSLKTIKGSSAGDYIDKTAKSGKTYKYKVKAVNGSKTATSKAQTAVRLVAPIIEDVSGWSVTLKWDDVSGAKKYEIYRAEITTSDLGIYETGEFKLVDTYVYDEEEYYTAEEENVFAVYKVRAVNGKSKSAFSNTVRVNYIATPDFGAWKNEEKNAVDVIFDPVKDASGYKIYRMPQGGEYELVTDISSAELENYKVESQFGTYCYTDTTIPDDGKVYYYAMEAYANRFSVKVPQPIWLP